MSAKGKLVMQFKHNGHIPIIYLKSLLTGYIRKYDIVLLCVFGGLLLTFLFGRHEWRKIILTPDSWQYHFMAVNMMQGKGCHMGPVGSVEDYNAQTIERFGVKEAAVAGSPSIIISRMPGYPLFLLLIYSIHGVDADAVLPYQLLLTGLTGALMVLTGWFMYGRFGAITAIIAVLVYGMNRELAWPTCELLTECLATFLLTAAAAAAAWARMGGWKREFFVSLLLIFAAFTKFTSFFIVIPYGVILIVEYFSVLKRRILVFTGLWLFAIISLGIYNSTHSGDAVTEGSTSSIVQTLYASIDPVEAAKKLQCAPPEINVKSLSYFWYSNGGWVTEQGDSVIKLLRGIPGRWKEVIKIKIIALKAGTDWMLRSLLAYILLGIALVSCTKINIDKLISGKDAATEVYVGQRGILRSTRSLKIILYLTVLLIIIITLGYSSTFIQMFFWLLPVALPLFGLEFVTGKEDHPACRHSWILSWYWGYVLMCMITISFPRLIRPFLPVFYLCAAMAIPLLVMTLLGLKQSVFKFSKGKIFKFKDCI